MCYQALLKEDFGCIASCHGLYADVEFVKEDIDPTKRLLTAVDADQFAELANEYRRYKNETMKNIRFDPTQSSLGINLAFGLEIKLSIYA